MPLGGGTPQDVVTELEGRSVHQPSWVQSKRHLSHTGKVFRSTPAPTMERVNAERDGDFKDTKDTREMDAYVDGFKGEKHEALNNLFSQSFAPEQTSTVGGSVKEWDAAQEMRRKVLRDQSFAVAADGIDERHGLGRSSQVDD